MDTSVFAGVIPALMTPCKDDRSPDFDALVRKAGQLMDAGMTAVVYCGSMGDWPLLTDAQRMEGVARLVAARIPVIVGTGAVNSRLAVEHATHAAEVGAAGLMVIPRVLSRGTSAIAQRHHFEAILSAAPELPAVIYNSPYYGFETKADLFFALRAKHSNLVGFKEFGGPQAMTYAAEHITSADDGVILMAGVDTGVYHGYVKCGATGTITGIGNVIPKEILHFVNLAQAAAAGDLEARQRARELGEALEVLSSWDEGTDLVLYYKHMMVLQGDPEYALHFNATDALTPSQKAWAERQFDQFRSWYAEWSALPGVVQSCRA
ncbi:dihydrodipicolinate synthase family protein [Paracoccus benzoatiresistens]|uniref:Dihydrodipicolinate synthase family protein n=1 Tax=Paracoccus benzoatiresistens TaxID=2997341 RepID=A0ABT4JB52_9RHOB|nr:dihydrodipicolinate synthase family protein [Paracoccus sp. EF6]MCZ0963701.1 dihydrodipicolinate synthase family protein [Paracoccus sp. EF6]